MRSGLVVLAGLVLVLGLVSACSGGGGASNGSGPPFGAGAAVPVAEADFPEQFVGAYCDNLGPCCGKYGVAFDRVTCLALVDEVRAAIRGRTDREYDPAAAGACVAAVRRVITACDAASVNSVDLTAASDDHDSQCGNVFKRPASALKQLGERCGADDECAAPPGGEVRCADVCRKVVRVADGEACVDTAGQPGDLRLCEGASTCSCKNCPTAGSVAADFRCSPRVGPGVSCAYDTCRDDLFCGDARTCEASKAAGAPCKNDDACAEGLSCDAAVCAAPPPGQLEGASCRDDRDCASRRCFQNACFTDAMGFPPEVCRDPLK